MGSRDTTATAHAGTAETATSVSRAGLSRGGEATVPCGPSAPMRAAGASCAGGVSTPQEVSVEGDVTCLPPYYIRVNVPLCSSFRITAPRLGKGPFLQQTFAPSHR